MDILDETTIFTRKHHPKHLKNCYKFFFFFFLWWFVGDGFRAYIAVYRLMGLDFNAVEVSG